MSTPGPTRARRPFALPLALGAAALAALLPVATAQMGSPGDIRLVVTGGEHEGEYVLSDVTIFMCGFGLPGPGWFSAQYFADDESAWPSSVQAAHRDEGAEEVDTPDLVVGFGDLMEDGEGYIVWESEGEGTVHTQVTDEGDTATLTVEARTATGVGLSLEVVCRGVTRFQGGGG